MITQKQAIEAATLSEKLFELIAPELAGKPPEVQSAALADMVAIWLAGNVIIGDRKATNELRAELLGNFIDVVCKLIPDHESMFDEVN